MSPVFADFTKTIRYVEVTTTLTDGYVRFSPRGGNRGKPSLSVFISDPWY
jgi:hypothetical protein